MTKRERKQRAKSHQKTFRLKLNLKGKIEIDRD